MLYREQIRGIKGHMPLQGYDLIGVMEMWWVSSHDRSAATGRYKLFRKDRRGGELLFFVKEQQRTTQSFVLGCE